MYVEGRGGYRSHTSKFYYHNPGDSARFLTLIVSSCCGEEHIYDKEKGCISSDDDNYGRRYISRDDGDSRGI